MRTDTAFLALAVGYAGASECLCVFDVDRTLTGKQGSAPSGACPADREVSGVRDSAYGGGTLTLSALAQGINGTFCNDCWLGVCSAGSASGTGSDEQKFLLASVLGGPNRVGNATSWSSGIPATSPLVVCQPDGKKQDAVKSIVDWYATVAKIVIAPSDVYFFDDRADNVKPFAGTGFNAHQISCASRDASKLGQVGLCGATVDEITRAKGIGSCS